MMTALDEEDLFITFEELLHLNHEDISLCVDKHIALSICRTSSAPPSKIYNLWVQKLLKVYNKEGFSTKDWQTIIEYLDKVLREFVRNFNSSDDTSCEELEQWWLDSQDLLKWMEAVVDSLDICILCLVMSFVLEIIIKTCKFSNDKNFKTLCNIQQLAVNLSNNYLYKIPIKELKDSESFIKIISSLCDVGSIISSIDLKTSVETWHAVAKLSEKLYNSKKKFSFAKNSPNLENNWSNKAILGIFNELKNILKFFDQNPSKNEKLLQIAQFYLKILKLIINYAKETTKTFPALKEFIEIYTFCQHEIVAKENPKIELFVKKPLFDIFSLISMENSMAEVDSEKWKEQNMNDLINMHLWPLEQVNSFSWVCINCGNVLYNFHQFYKRIKIAQENFRKNFKNVIEASPALHQKEFLQNENSDRFGDDCKDIAIYKNDIKDSRLDQPLPTEFIIDGPFIKNEKEDNLSDVDIKLKKTNRKRGRPARDKSKNLSEDQQDPLLGTRNKNRKSKRFNIGENQTELISEEINNSPSLLDIMETNDSETDTEYQDDKEMCAETIKKKNHRNLDEKILKEYDKIIAENFKIFCNLCQIEVDNFLSLRKHFKIEHKRRGYARCCKRNFFTRSLLVDHIQVHLNPEYFKCQQCSKVFSDRSRLLCHKKLHEDDSKLDKCDICGKLFADKGALKKHVQTHSSEKLFPCSICGKYFTNSFILNHHVEAVHENKFVQICDICGKSIRCPTAFASHMEKHEVKTTPISCDVCGLLLTNKEGLKRHKNSQHPEGGKKEHTCHICSKVSPTLRALKSHIRSVHEQGFDFKCSLCEKSFKRPAVLREHMATHTGTALYACPWCPRTFISNGNMYNHRKNAHPKEWEELKRQKYAGTVQ